MSIKHELGQGRNDPVDLTLPDYLAWLSILVVVVTILIQCVKGGL